MVFYPQDDGRHPMKVKSVYIKKQKWGCLGLK